MSPEDKEFYNAKASILKALSHPTRLWIVDQLARGEKCVCEFVDEIEADTSTVSKHLAVLKQAGIIRDEKRGKWVYYTLKVPCVLNFSGCIETIIKNQAKDQIAFLG
ncbi:MAG TPA: ArsR family transcriptional regulator [Desulfobacterales bacterium]|nr:ArsR family transcriptional regulator [Desulfobacterales bacterium]